MFRFGKSRVNETRNTGNAAFRISDTPDPNYIVRDIKSFFTLILRIP